MGPIDAVAIGTPSARVLDELSDIDLAELRGLEFSPVSAMHSVDAGSIEVPGLSGRAWPLLGYPNDIHVGPPSFRLFMAGLSLERLLLVAWRDTGNERWLRTALERTLQFATYEEKTAHEQDFLWNDHAVACRASVVIGLWTGLQAAPALREAHGRALLSFVVRTGRMLAKPSQFTVRTNHGVMQNLALLQLAVAFPGLPESSHWRDVADHRLRMQLGFYVSPEGVVLEHSPGYHAMGTALLAHGQRLRQLNGLPADPALDAAVAGSAKVLQTLIRPDGTLPAVGNTDGQAPHQIAHGAESGRKPVSLLTPAAQPRDDVHLFPIAGWGVWWSRTTDESSAQVMFTWANHVGHGHKHADEGAFTWWSRNRDWITGVGYWPYGDALTRKSYEWAGANAVHGPGETLSSRRMSSLRAHGDQGAVRFAEIERLRDDGAAFTRQLLQLDADTLVVLDFHANSIGGAETFWTLAPGLRWRAESGDARAWFTDPGLDRWRMHLAMDSTRPLQTHTLSADPKSAAGWTTVRRLPRPAQSLRVISTSPTSITASVFHLSPNAQVARISLNPGASLTNWQVAVEHGQGRTQIVRADGVIHIDTTPTPGQRIAAGGQLNLGTPTIEPGANRLSQSYLAAVAAYPPWRDLWRYRAEFTYLLLGLLIAIEASWWVSRRWLRSRWQGAPRWAGIGVALGWATVAFWILTIQLKS